MRSAAQGARPAGHAARSEALRGSRGARRAAAKPRASRVRGADREEQECDAAGDLLRLRRPPERRPTARLLPYGRPSGPTFSARATLSPWVWV